MSVNIGISANPSQVVNAFDSVRDAIRRAGQEGRAFRDLDLSHPELANFAQDLGKMQRQIEDLTRVSQGATARSARRVFSASPAGANPLDWDAHDADWARMYPDEAERRRLQSRVQTFVTQGTSFAPAPPMPPPAPTLPPPLPPRPPGPEYSNEAEDAAKGLPPILRSAARAAVQGATFGLSMAGIGGIRSVISNSYHSAVDEGSSNDNLFRRMPELSQSFDTLRESVRRASDGMGITYNEAQRMAGIFVRTRGDPRTPGHGGQDSIGAWTNLAAGFGRSAGMDASTSASMFARASNFQDGDKFAMLVGEAAARGFQTGNMERVMESILRYQETTSRILVSSSGNVEGFAGMWAAMNASSNPGMRGDNATALIGQIDNAVRQGGMGGHASEAVNWRAFARAGVTDPYEMQYLQEGGMFQKVGKGTLFSAESDEINRQYRGLPERQRQAALARHFGITMHQAEALQGLKPEGMNGTASMLDGYGIDPSKMNPTSFVDLAKLRASGDWEGGRKRLLDRSDLSADERSSLGAAKGDQLQELVVRLMATKGMSGTVSSEHTDATVGLQNKMTEFGDLVVKPMTALKSGITDLADAIKMLGSLMIGGAPAPGAMPYLGGNNGNAGDGITPAAFRQIIGGGRGGAGGGSFRMGTAGPTNVAGSIPLAERGRILDAATSGTMVPPELLDGLISQESQWRPDAQRQGGSDLGLGQITDSTAGGPGFGMEPISRADRTDPVKAARWSARYLEARGKALGLTRPEDWRDPAKVARALRGYNDGGDPNYAEHVFSHMRPHQASRPAAGGGEIRGSFEPLRIIHEDRNGNQLHEQELLVRPVTSPTAYGSA